ncbi:MAG: metallophosphoesterase family protein [Candidatus Njordarchaeia archaeon]
MTIRFLENLPALLINDSNMVVADLHFGAPKITDIDSVIYFINNDCYRLHKAISTIKPSKLIILGDVKENIGAFAPEPIRHAILNCFNKAKELGSDVIFVLGNHDGGLESLLIDGDFKYTKMLQLKHRKLNILLIHGHRKLKAEELDNIDVVISGHVHPGYLVTDGTINIVVKAWFVSKVKLGEKNIDWIITPSFSTLISGMALNNLSDIEIKEISPFPREIEIMSKRYFLLDLTPMF